MRGSQMLHTVMAVVCSSLLTGSITWHLASQPTPPALLEAGRNGTAVGGGAGKAACPSCLDPWNASSAGTAGAGGGGGGGQRPLVELPAGTERVIINVGCNLTPIMPPEGDNATMVIAVEPILETAARIPKHPRLWVIAAAVASGPARLQTMRIHNVVGASSSLAAPKDEAAFWVGAAKAKGWPDRQVVPVISMSLLLGSIPRSVEITYLKTDMQGYDFVAVSSAGGLIRRVKEVMAEVYVRNAAPYEGVSNDLKKDWEPHMKKMGYERRPLPGKETAGERYNRKKMGETNALWHRVGPDDSR